MARQAHPLPQIRNAAFLLGGDQAGHPAAVLVRRRAYDPAAKTRPCRSFLFAVTFRSLSPSMSYHLHVFIAKKPKPNKKPACAGGWSGNVLFSHRAAPAVSSELEGLTAVFGMGTGVSLPL